MGSFFSIILLMLTSFASTGFSQSMLVDDGLSPLQRFESGYRISGVYNANSILYCSPQAQRTHIPQLLPDLYVLKQLPSGALLTTQNQIQNYNNLIKRALDTLSEQNDVATLNKHICTGFYIDRDSHIGNALSFIHGYLIFDYKMIEHLFSLPDEKRTFWVEDFLVLHELAHQLQYWNNDGEVLKTLNGEQSAKRPELAADCAAGALIKLMNLDLPLELYTLSFSGVENAAELIGDDAIDDPTHHGLPDERRQAVRYGSDMITALRPFIKNKTLKVSSRYILDNCNQFVRDQLD